MTAPTGTHVFLDQLSQAQLQASLQRGQVHVWMVRPDTINDPKLLESYRHILDEPEQARYQRYMFERDRHLFLVAHALVRCCLSRYADIAPEAWRFDIGSHGRPEIAKAHNVSGLRFNLSHTQGLAVCAVGMGHDLGVDVEWLPRRSETSAIAHRYFSASEVHDLRQVPAHEQRQRFFCYWTLKEAYIKAKGLGLAIPLGSFSFELHPQAALQNSIGIRFADTLDDDPDRWRFDLRMVGAEHLLALAQHAPAARRLDVDLSEWVPQLDGVGSKGHAPSAGEDIST